MLMNLCRVSAHFMFFERYTRTLFGVSVDRARLSFPRKNEKCFEILYAKYKKNEGYASLAGAFIMHARGRCPSKRY